MSDLICIIGCLVLLAVPFWLDWRRRRKIVTHRFITSRGGHIDLAKCQCNRCKNCFWVQYIELEQPSFCPYCGIHFIEGIQVEREME